MPVAPAPLKPAADLKALLRRCHTRLHATGAGTLEEDLTLDMVRILLAKVADERAEGRPRRFVVGPGEAETAPGRAAIAGRVRALFAEVRAANAAVFDADERISVSDTALAAVAGELAGVALLPDHPLSESWDLLGLAYEEMTATAMKRRRGQFFTNRLVVGLLVEMVAPTWSDRVLDPAGGSAGFVTGALRHVRAGLAGDADGAARLDHFCGRMAVLDVSRRLVRVARAAMLLHGDASSGVGCGDALGPPDALPLPQRAPLGGVDVVLTNPPFAGTGDGRLTAPDLLRRFEVGHRWEIRDGRPARTDDLLSEGAPPELLFIERCVRWLAPGGRLGIVLPKSILDTRTFLPARALLLRDCVLRAVVILHKHTFQPYTGVRTALVVVERRPTGQVGPLPTDPDVFMALSRSVGQDSEGAPVYERDATGRPTPRLDEDLTAIGAAYAAHQAGTLEGSEYRFSIPTVDITAPDLNISPQAHRPSLNATLRTLEALEDRPGWRVVPLGALCPGIEVFKGPRLKSENLLVDPSRAGEPGVEPYYTPGAVLQGRADAAKTLDLRRASPKQRATIDRVRVRLGDLVLTRSGTIGRVARVSSMFQDAIVSDDLIRVRVPDERLRLYLWAWLSSRGAQDQIMRNEYGAIQQHLEPQHVRQLLVPLPEDPALIDGIVAARAAMRDAREALLAGRRQSARAVEELEAALWG